VGERFERRCIWGWPIGQMVAGVLAARASTRTMIDRSSMQCTQDSLALIRVALRGVRPIFRQGFKCWKAGVMLNQLVDASSAPAQMFPARDPPEHASIPIKEVYMLAVKVISCFWVNFFFSSNMPLSPRATNERSSCQDECRPNESACR